MNHIINKENYSIDYFHNTIPLEDSSDLTLNRLNHLKYAVTNISINGSILEFGVHTGSTINFIADLCPMDNLYGFDSFEGLPEDWNISSTEKFNKHKKGYFALETLPEVRNNVTLIKGFFDTSVSPWLASTNIREIKLLHIDSDLYSSALYVLTTLNNYIVPGTIIVFDEFYPWGRKRYETWAEHEYKALNEWIVQFDRSFEIISRNTHQQCAIKIVK